MSPDPVEVTEIQDVRPDPEEHEAAETVSVTVRVAPELAERLRTAASERLVSTNLLVTKAIEGFLDDLIPIDELQLTRTPRGGKK